MMNELQSPGLASGFLTDITYHVIRHSGLYLIVLYNIDLINVLFSYLVMDTNKMFFRKYIFCSSTNTL